MLRDERRIRRQVGGMENDTSLFTIDPGHSAVGFSVRHLMITNVRGAFEKFSGTITYDASRPEATRIEATIDVASVSTRHAQRDGDLRGELFFDVAHHPMMTFVSRSARAVGPGAIDVVGALTIRGVAREVTLAVRDISDVVTDLRGGKRLGATATTSIKRSDYGMTWNKAIEAGGVVVGDVVTIVLEASLLQAS
jgi:polyisoprenoid-binding protein YceI